MDDVIIYSNGFLHCSACTTLTDLADLTRRVNALNLCGTEHGWILDDAKTFKDGVTPNPCVCERNPERKHYLFVC